MQCGQGISEKGRSTHTPTADMVLWEVCQLVPAWGKVKGKTRHWYEAHRSTPQGAAVIAKGDEYAHPGDEMGLFGALYREIFDPNLKKQTEDHELLISRQRSSHASLIAILLAQGWEPAGTDRIGMISAMKRLKTESSAS